jgi:pimeloyl-ACP methyl ester carboxylesterase
VPDLRIQYIERCSHWVQQERPELVNRWLLAFLEEENHG